MLRENVWKSKRTWLLRNVKSCKGSGCVCCHTLSSLQVTTICLRLIGPQISALWVSRFVKYWHIILVARSTYPPEATVFDGLGMRRNVLQIAPLTKLKGVVHPKKKVRPGLHHFLTFQNGSHPKRMKESFFKKLYQSNLPNLESFSCAAVAHAQFSKCVRVQVWLSALQSTFHNVFEFGIVSLSFLQIACQPQCLRLKTHMDKSVSVPKEHKAFPDSQILAHTKKHKQKENSKRALASMSPHFSPRGCRAPASVPSSGHSGLLSENCRTQTKRALCLPKQIIAPIN